MDVRATEQLFLSLVVSSSGSRWRVKVDQHLCGDDDQDDDAVAADDEVEADTFPSLHAVCGVGAETRSRSRQPRSLGWGALRSFFRTEIRRRRRLGSSKVQDRGRIKVQTLQTRSKVQGARGRSRGSRRRSSKLLFGE